MVYRMKENALCVRVARKNELVEWVCQMKCAFEMLQFGSKREKKEKFQFELQKKGAF